jgi:4-hydroxybenzoate polyprenyltransferase
MSALGSALGLSIWYWLSVMIAALAMAWFVLRLYRADHTHDRAEYFAVFKANHWIGLVLLLGICTSLWFPVAG